MHTGQQLRRTIELAETLERRINYLNTQLAGMTTRMTSMAETVATLARVTITSGQGSVPAMLLGTSREVTVTLRDAMPDTTYSATATLTGGTNLLSAVVVDGITALTTTTVTVQVRATGVLSAGATVTVHAVRHN